MPVTDIAARQPVHDAPALRATKEFERTSGALSGSTDWIS